GRGRMGLDRPDRRCLGAGRPIPAALRPGHVRAGGCADADAPRPPALARHRALRMVGPAIVERPAAELAERLADDVAGWLAEAIGGRGSASLVVPGGGTPGPFLDALALRGIDWSRVVVVPSDERCVPLDSPRSNEAMIRARLLRERAAAELVSLLPVADGGEAAAQVAGRVRALLPID